MAGNADAENARRSWEIENEIETLPPSDEIFRYDSQEQQQFLAARKLSNSFSNNNNFFFSCVIEIILFD